MKMLNSGESLTSKIGKTCPNFCLAPLINLRRYLEYTYNLRMSDISGMWKFKTTHTKGEVSNYPPISLHGTMVHINKLPTSLCFRVQTRLQHNTDGYSHILKFSTDLCGMWNFKSAPAKPEDFNNSPVQIIKSVCVVCRPFYYWFSLYGCQWWNLARKYLFNFGV
jgi:hypothetical protein